MTGKSVLVVEDDYFLAQDIAQGLKNAGARVLGPAGTIDDALDLIEDEVVIDGAVLDVNLHGDTAYPVAEALEARSVPYVFTTGYDAGAIDRRYATIKRCEKPVKVPQIAQALFG